jgi:hypothetical protein
MWKDSKKFIHNLIFYTFFSVIGRVRAAVGVLWDGRINR